MTSTASAGPAVLTPRAVPHVTRLLESDFGSGMDRRIAALSHMYLLDALDRGERDRFLIWPVHDPIAVLYVSSTGTLVPGGDPAAGAALGEPAERQGWRVMIGDAAICTALLEAVPRTLFRRRVSSREQRFLVADPSTGSIPARADLPPAGFRPARQVDLERLTDFACRLHVEDRMGPPISRAGRSAVRSRMLDSIVRGDSYVLVRGGVVVGKADVSVRSAHRGGQIAGVFTAPAARGQGIATELVSALTRLLLGEGLPGVSLHVRADNAPAIAAYRRAGFVDRGRWLLALR